MKQPKPIFVKILVSLILIIASYAAAIMLGNLLLPDPSNTFSQLIKAGSNLTPELKQLVLNMKLSQGIQTIGLFLMPPLIILTVFYKAKGFMLPLATGIKGWDIFYVVFLIIFANTLMYVVARFCQQIPWPESFVTYNEQNLKLTALLVNGVGYGDLAINLVIVSILPAVCEELFFRGLLQRLLMKWIGDPHINIFIAAVVFSAFHFDPVMFIPRFLLGAIMGYLFYWSGSLLLPMLAHFINNAQFVIGAFIINKLQPGKLLQDTTDVDVNNFNLILSVLIVALLLSSIYRRHMSVKEYIRIGL